MGIHQNVICASGTILKTTADAIVIPLPITGHKNAACAVVNGKISDIIMEYYTNWNPLLLCV